VKLTLIDRARQTESSAICFSCGTSLRANRSMEYVTKPFFIGFWDLRVLLILLIMMLETPLDRARRAASNDVNFARGTDRGSNIFAEYLICVLFPMVKNHFFINI
jgi:hypothetical protein